MSISRLSEHDKYKYSERVRSLVNYALYVDPFPVSGTESIIDMVRYGWPDSLRKAVETVEQSGYNVDGLINKEEFILMHANWGDHSIKLRISLSNPRFMYENWTDAPKEIHTISAEHPKWGSILHWCKNVKDMYDRSRKTIRFAENVLQYCNTIGQVHRVWPELVSVAFEIDAKQLVSAAQRTSRLPKGIEVNDPQFIEERKEHSEILATAKLVKQIGAKNPVQVAGAKV